MKNDAAKADIMFDSTADVDRTSLRENLELNFRATRAKAFACVANG
jgi:hypothetical protein